MRVFVGFGYNDRDKWIEEQVFPILRGMGFIVVDGKHMHGKVLQPQVKTRIEQSDAVVGFFTIRDGQGDADFNSHIWVRDELVYAVAQGKPVIPIQEGGAKIPDGLLGDRQYIQLSQTDRLACVVELVGALGGKIPRRLKLDPETDELSRSLRQWSKTPGFNIQYRIQDDTSLASQFRSGNLELIDDRFYLNVTEMPRRAYVEVEGTLKGQTKFSSGWQSADAVQVKIYRFEEW